MIDAAPPDGLGALEKRLAQDLRWLNLPAKDWVPSRSVEGAPVLDVAIAGWWPRWPGCKAAALRRVGIFNIAIYDRAPAGQEGPWVTYARMRTLRTRKEASGPALGIPSLTFRAWFEAQYGVETWDGMNKIPRPMWMDYLIWYRKVPPIYMPVHNDTSVTAIVPRSDGLIALQLERFIRLTNNHRASRRVGYRPRWIGRPRRAVDCTHHRSSFLGAWLRSDRFRCLARQTRRRGWRGRVGHGQCGHRAGSRRGTRRPFHPRRERIPTTDKFSGVGSPGMVHGYFGLPPELKWRYQYYGNLAQIPPPQPRSTLRVSHYPNAYFHLGSPILAAEQEGESLVVTTPKGRYALDFLIFTTGFGIDFARRPRACGDRTLYPSLARQLYAAGRRTAAKNLP